MDSIFQSDVYVSGDYAYVADHDGGLVVLEHKHRRYDLVDNAVYSNVVATSDANIISARLTTLQTEYIAWNVSSDGGVHWDFIPPDGNTYEITHPGTLLMWRSTHFYDAGQINPTCTWLHIEYFMEETGVDDGLVPAVLALRQNMPNPFRGGTTVRYEIPYDGLSATVEVFDVSGRRVRTLASGPQAAGVNAVPWDGRNDRGVEVASGVYYCRMTARDFDDTIKLILLR